MAAEAGTFAAGTPYQSVRPSHANACAVGGEVRREAIRPRPRPGFGVAPGQDPRGDKRQRQGGRGDPWCRRDGAEGARKRLGAAGPRRPRETAGAEVGRSEEAGGRLSLTDVRRRFSVM